MTHTRFIQNSNYNKIDIGFFESFILMHLTRFFEAKIEIVDFFINSFIVHKDVPTEDFFKKYTKDEIYLLINMWIYFFGFITYEDFNSFELFQNSLLNNMFSTNYNVHLFNIDMHMGDMQVKYCRYMLHIDNNEYLLAIKKSKKIKMFYNVLKNSKPLSDEYINGKRCYSLMWIENHYNFSNYIYYTITGGSEREIFYNEIIKELIPSNLQYDAILLNDKVRYYHDDIMYELYDPTRWKDKEYYCNFTCCERKLLSKVEKLGKTSTYILFIKRSPCSKCKKALNDLKRTYSVQLYPK